MYAGLAAFYFLRDHWDTGLRNNGADLPYGAQEIELAIQDRMFDTNGQLFFPDNGVNLDHQYWVPEFFGDVMVVNGKSWPYLNVEPRRYRFRLLDGCNARFLEMALSENLPIWQIGGDGGLLKTPVRITPDNVSGLQKLLLAPGERADIIIDFTGKQGKTYTLLNTAAYPYPTGSLPDPANDGQIMQFRVTLPLSGKDGSMDPSTYPSLRAPDQPLVELVNFTNGTAAAGVTPDITRELVLKEDENVLTGNPEAVFVNNTAMMSAVTEHPQEGNTELWKIVNLTMDAHPMHLHLVQFQLVSRQNFNINQYLTDWTGLFPGGLNMWDNTTYAPGQYMPGFGPPKPYNYYAPIYGGNPDVSPYLTGTPVPADPNEQGWKDTYKCYPGQVTTFLVRYAPTDKPIKTQKKQLFYPFDPSSTVGYVWHCHIVDHEDNEMMRPYDVTANPFYVGPPRKESEADNPGSTLASDFRLDTAYPNPFNPSTTIRFSLAESGTASLKVYNSLGREVQTIADGQFDAGVHAVSWNASNLPSGTYFYRLKAGDHTDMKTVTLMK